MTEDSFGVYLKDDITTTDELGKFIDTLGIDHSKVGSTVYTDTTGRYITILVNSCKALELASVVKVRESNGDIIDPNFYEKCKSFIEKLAADSKTMNRN